MIDRGHPKVADMAVVVRDDDCPPVEINTTALVSTPAACVVAKASQRYVFGDFRLVESSAAATRRSPPRNSRPRSCFAPARGDVYDFGDSGVQAGGSRGWPGNRKSMNAAAVGWGSWLASPGRSLASMKT